MYSIPSIHRKNLFIFLITVTLTTMTMASGQKKAIEAKTLQDEPVITGEVFVTTMQADGSPYLLDDWARGDVVLRDGSVARDQDLRYHGYLDELIWRQPRSMQSIKVDKQQVASFTLYPGEQDTLTFKNLTISPWYESGEINFYAQILYEGDVSLVAHQRIRRTGETHRSTGGRIISRPRIELDPVYYFVMPDDEAREVGRKSNRSVSRLFPDHRRDVRSALRNAGIRINDERDMKEAARIIDTLYQDW